MSAELDRVDVLVIDDQDEIRTTIQDVLEEEGFCVTAAAGGEEALRRLRGGLRPGIVLLDLMMPGVNGWDVWRAMKDDPKLCDIPIVILSGDGQIEQKVAVLGGVPYFKKPIELDSLIEVVKTARRA